jgi:nitroreductase
MSRLLKDMLRRGLRGVSGAGRRFRKRLAHAAAGCKAGSNWYYALFSKAFAREQQAVLQGMRQYERECGQLDNPAFLLRRGIHRLEKGLLMRPRRDLFAVTVITETMDAYEALLKGGDDVATTRAELLWAYDVLATYFAAVASDPVVDAQRERFATLPPPPGASEKPARVPQALAMLDAHGVDLDAFERLARHRKSVRWFLDKPVPREVLDRAVKIAGTAPSACNRQPFEFRIFDDPERVRRVAELPMGAVHYKDNIPVLVVVIGRQNAFFSERDRHVIYIDGSLAAMNFMLALEAAGLNSCAINWPDIADREKALAEALGLEPWERGILMIAVGYGDPEGMVAHSARKDISALRRYNEA